MKKKRKTPFRSDQQRNIGNAISSVITRLIPKTSTVIIVSLISLPRWPWRHLFAPKRTTFIRPALPLSMALALSAAKFPDLALCRPLLPFRLLSLSLRFSLQNPNPRFLHCASRTPSTPWLHQWDSPPPSPENSKPSHSPSSSIDRIVHRLRNLELGDEEIEQEQKEESVAPLNGDEKLADLLQRSWTRPDLPSDSDRTAVLPWQRRRAEYTEVWEEEKERKKRRVRAPSLAELTIEDEELRRLRRMGMVLRERINVPKAGITSEVLEKIHDGWRKLELVRLKFHEDLAHDMKTAHEIVEV